MPDANQIAVLGNIGEFIGSIAVFVTLVYLATQVRQSRQLLEENRKIALSDVFLGRVELRMGYHLGLAEPHNAAVLAKVQFSGNVDTAMEQYGHLSEPEKVQYYNLQAAAIQAVDNTLYQNQLELLDELQISTTRRFAQEMYPLWKVLNLPTERIREFLDGGT